MPISEDSRAALVLLKEVQQSVRDTDDLKSNSQVLFVNTYVRDLGLINKKM